MEVLEDYHRCKHNERAMTPLRAEVEIYQVEIMTSKSLWRPKGTEPPHNQFIAKHNKKRAYEQFDRLHCIRLEKWKWQG